VLATVATQSAIVVLAPLVVEIGRSFDASVSAVGAARSVLAGAAVAVSLAIGPLIDRVGVRPLIVWGAVLAVAGAGVTAAAPTLGLFYGAHAVSGAGVACLLSAGFAGVAAFFPREDAAWALGYVVGAQSIAWIAGNPVIGVLAEAGSWRLAYLVPAAIAGLALAAGLTVPAGGAAGRAGAVGAAGPGAPHAAGAGPGAPHAAGPGAPRGAGAPLTAVFRNPSARRWTIAELVAYSAWTAELTYSGAFYIQSYGVGEATVGVLLAVGSVVFLATSVNTERLARRFPRRPLIAAAALAMGLLLVPLLSLTPSIAFTLGLFCLTALFASIRSTGSSALGLAQFPDRPGAMMGARTAGAQLGYMIGAAAGGLVLALADFAALGLVLFAGMAASALLVLRVSDPPELSAS
jgi:predicted MFS family arabinose efflux permease